MKLTRFICLGIATAMLLAGPTLAAPVLTPPGGTEPNIRIVGIADATAGYTNATTGLTDITAATITVPATRANFGLQYIRTCWTADATKATSTTGSIEVFVNGAAVAASKRTITSAAGQSTMAECFTVARSSGAIQTVKLQGISGDSATFTVANAQIEVDILYNLAM